MAKLIWSEKAINDLEMIAEFIALDSLKYASLTVQKLYNYSKTLKKFPKSGRIVPELNDETIKELIAGNYRIIYSLKNPEKIEILTVHHSARNFPKSII